MNIYKEKDEDKSNDRHYLCGMVGKFPASSVKKYIDACTLQIGTWPRRIQ